MKRIYLVLLCAALLAILVAPVHAQDLSKADRSALVNYLKETRAGVERATKGLTDDQLKFKPAADRWSLAECMEHIAAAEDYLFGLIKDKVMKSPGLEEPFDLAKAHELDAKVKAGVTDRSQKAQAPEPLVPTNRWNMREIMKETGDRFRAAQELDAVSACGSQMTCVDLLSDSFCHGERARK